MSVPSLTVTVLGSGTSGGVPLIGCDCAVCGSADSRDKRLRPSIFIELGQPAFGLQSPAPSLQPPASGVSSAVRNILVDTSSDLRAQALAHGVKRVDAILFTHSHADHVMGLDDVRRFNFMQGGPMPCFGDARTIDDLRRTFSYAFTTDPNAGGGVPRLSMFTIGGPFMLGGLEVIPVPIYHGARRILGFRIGGFAYLTDCSRIPDESWPLLEGLDTLVLDALRHRPHPTHFTVAEALDAVARVAPRRAYFTHICHDLPHAATSASLPNGVELAYDGLILQI